MKSNYTGVWCIIALALTLFLTFSFLDVDLNIGGWHPKKAPFKEKLLSDSRGFSDSDSATMASERIVGSLHDRVVQAVDSTPQSILLIGDSMTLNLALQLARYAAQNGHIFNAVNWDSSNTRIWGASDTLAHFIREFDATYVFVSLGSNELYLKHPNSRKPDVQRILAQIGELPYIWIGPPNWKEDFGINDMIESQCRPGTFFRSAGMTFERKKDHVHPTRHASALWIDSIMRWMPQSAHPILADVPPDTLGKVNPHVTFLKARNK